MKFWFRQVCSLVLGRSLVTVLALLSWCNPAVSDQFDDVCRAGSDGDLVTLKALLGTNPALASAYDGFATPLHCAARTGQKDAAELLLVNHAEVGARDTYGQTPLHWAAGRGYTQIVELFLEHGADVNARDNDGETPLHIAARELGLRAVRDPAGREAIAQRQTAELLLAHGANVNVQDKDGWTPLHWAADRSSGTLAEVLLAKGADVTARSKGGYTPLHFAAAAGDSALVALLLAGHAEVNAADDKGETPLRVALIGHKDVMELLRQQGGHN